jgi:hypothetical protein
MLTVSSAYKAAATKSLTQPGFLVKVGWSTPKYFSSRGDITYKIPGEYNSTTFKSTPLNVTAVNTDVTVKSTGTLSIGIDPVNPLNVTQYALGDSYGFANIPIEIWLFDNANTYKLSWWYASNSAGMYVSTPDSTLNSVTDDIDIRADLAATDWTPSTAGTIIAKRLAATGISYRFACSTTGYLVLDISLNGTTAVTYTSTSPHVLVDGGRYWVRVTRVALTGAVNFYTSLDGGLTWTKLGNTITSNAGSIFNSTTALELGSYVSGTVDRLQGYVYRVQIYNGIQGTPYILLDGASGTFCKCVDSVANSSTGDTDFRIQANLDNWTPASAQVLLSKNTTDSTGFSYLLQVNAAGTLTFNWSLDGTTIKTATSSVAVSSLVAAGNTIWIRCVIITNNGASNQDVYFYTSTNYSPTFNTGTWTQLGTTISVAGTGNIFDSSDDIRLGAKGTSGTAGMCVGKIYRAQVFKGMNGNLTIDCDPSQLLTGNISTFTSPGTGESWILAGTAKIGGVLVSDFYPVDDTGFVTTFTSFNTGETYTYSNGASITERVTTATEIATIDAIKIFKGVGDSVALSATELQATLVPLNLVSLVAPRIRINPKNGFNYIQPKGTVVTWGTERFTLE